jgi:hypothetical protein
VFAFALSTIATGLGELNRLVGTPRWSADHARIRDGVR